MWGIVFKIDESDQHVILARGNNIGYFKIDWETSNKFINNYINEIKIYPNPARNQIQIELPQEMAYSEMQFSITDINGKLRLEKEAIINKNLFEIYIDLPAGVYFLNINTKEFSSTRKFVVE